MNVNPTFPYHLEDKPHVKYWFPTSNGANVELFDELLSSENLDRLEDEGGVCLVYVHLGGGGFVRDGRVDPRFEERIRDLASRDGWFVPAAEILDHLRATSNQTRLSFRERLRLDTLFLLSRVFGGVD